MGKIIIDKFYEELCKIYEKENLISLSNTGYNYKGYNVMDCPLNKNNSDKNFNHFINHWDIITCSDDLKYFTGQLFFYKPFINNPEKEVIMPDKISTYFQNLEDKRYLMFVTCSFEKAYNYWDRIGDRIASFFPDLLKSHQVNFSKIIDEVSKLDIESEDFMWLKGFKENQYKELNGVRKNMVHYYQYESKYRYDHTMNSSDLEKIKILWEEKISFPNYFKQHLNYALEGYIKMCLFLKEMIKS